MKKNFNTLICATAIMFFAMSCSSNRYAYSQDGDYAANYDDTYTDDEDNGDEDYDYYNEEPEVTMDMFNTSLSPYGRWVMVPQYGNVWICNEPGFSPYYSNGNWRYTRYGWTWVSNYKWGWAPFHYGRWAFDNYYGWMWQPGYEWGPAWVNWRTGGDYYGWAPLGPGMHVGVGVNLSFGIPANRWCFIPRRYIGSANFHNYRVRPERNVTIINNTTVINNIHVRNNNHFVAGPGRLDVERATHQKVKEVSIRQIAKEKNYNVVVNKPVIKNDNRVINKKDINKKEDIHINNNNKVKNERNTVINKDIKKDEQKSVDEKKVILNNGNNNNVPVQQGNTNGNDKEKKIKKSKPESLNTMNAPVTNVPDKRKDRITQQPQINTDNDKNEINKKRNAGTAINPGAMNNNPVRIKKQRQPAVQPMNTPNVQPQVNAQAPQQQPVNKNNGRKKKVN